MSPAANQCLPAKGRPARGGPQRASRRALGRSRRLLFSGWGLIISTIAMGCKNNNNRNSNTSTRDWAHSAPALIPAFCSRMSDYASIFLPEGWGGGGLNDVLAPPQPKKLEQESTAEMYRASFTGRGSRSSTSHRFLTVFAQVSHGFLAVFSQTLGNRISFPTGFS